jgi:hypothetical protein
VRLAFGGMAATVQARRAGRGRAAGQPWTEATLQAAMAALAQDFTAADRHARQRGYRLQVAQPVAPLLAADAARGPLACDPPLSVWAARSRRHEHRPAAPVVTAVGQSLPHESAHLHVAGAAPYTDDLPEAAGTLHAALGLSPLAHGVIEALDLDAIRAMPGVVAVLSARRHPRPNECGALVHDDPILAGEVGSTLRYLGQPVFVVVARTRDRGAPRGSAGPPGHPRAGAAAHADGRTSACRAAVRGAAHAPAARRCGRRHRGCAAADRVPL